MQANQIKLGQRVLIGSKNALVVGRPEYYTPRKKLVRIKYENSTRYEYQINTNLELLPIQEQYPTHGGTHQRQEGEM